MGETFVEQWRTLLSDPHSGKKDVELGQPIRLIFGANDAGRPVFFSITTLKPGLPELSNVVAVERGMRTVDGKWTLSLTLRDDRLRDVFISLCEDLAQRTARTDSESAAMSALLGGVTEWRHLLRPTSSSRLSPEEVRGLVAELWFGLDQLTRIYPPRDVIAAWTGPAGRPQDYNFARGIAFEVKSRHPDSKSIRISSAEQLDPGDRALTLAVVTLEPARRDIPAAISIASLVALGERVLGSDFAEVDLLRGRLESLGVDLLDDYYDEYWFLVAGLRLFRVGPDFPAIRASQLPDGVLGVEYSLAVLALKQHEIPSTEPDPTWRDA